MGKEIDFNRLVAVDCPRCGRRNWYIGKESRCVNCELTYSEALKWNKDNSLEEK